VIFVEDQRVEQAMISFSLAIDDFQGGWIKTDDLKREAKALVDVCRESAEDLGNN
jgi:hypothetical protein